MNSALAKRALEMYMFSSERKLGFGVRVHPHQKSQEILPPPPPPTEGGYIKLSAARRTELQPLPVPAPWLRVWQHWANRRRLSKGRKRIDKHIHSDCLIDSDVLWSVVETLSHIPSFFSRDGLSCCRTNW